VFFGKKGCEEGLPKAANPANQVLNPISETATTPAYDNATTGYSNTNLHVSSEFWPSQRLAIQNSFSVHKASIVTRKHLMAYTPGPIDSLAGFVSVIASYEHRVGHARRFDMSNISCDFVSVVV